MTPAVLPMGVEPDRRWVELRGLEPLTPTLPGRHDRVRGGSLWFRKGRDLRVWTSVNTGVRPRTPLTATTSDVRTGLATRFTAPPCSRRADNCHCRTPTGPSRGMYQIDGGDARYR